jgi:predicted nucleotidyltransferase
MTGIHLPTPAHQRAADTIVAFFRTQPHVDAVLLVNSCARGAATPESDLDVAVLVGSTLTPPEQTALHQQWQALYATEGVFHDLRQAGRFTGVHLDLFDEQFVPETWDDGGGPDGFELAIGNQVAYSVPRWEGASAFADLRARWLPFYAPELQHTRLTMVRDACRYDLAHVPFYVARGLCFQAFDRLYKAFQEFLQALFIARRTYPLAYNKWIREQVEGWLGLPELYRQLPAVLEIGRLESADVERNAGVLQGLLDEWSVLEAPGARKRGVRGLGDASPTCTD